MDRLPLTSKDVLAEKIARIREEFPEVFSEGKIDFERLKMVLGEFVDNGRERYGLSWAGKSEAIRNIQTPSVGTLLPVPEESVNFETSENLIIEGDNLEVLKLLQKSYHGKIKMIYIDPPYNTGNEFIYPDNFREGLEDYLRYSGQVDGDGIKLTTNTETDGRFHSKWLNMMYPRLFLARNLLREDGLIFVSIDDNEVHNLRMMMNEIYGEENHVITLIWHRRQNADSRNLNNASTDHEYIVVYGRSRSGKFRGKSIDVTKYKNPDNDPRGPWASIDLSGLATKEQRPNLHFDIIDPTTGIAYPPNPSRGWSKSKETIEAMIERGEILFPSNPNGRPRQKKFLRDLKSDTTGFSSMLKDVGYTTDGTREVTEIFGYRAFPFPKPVKLIRSLVAQCVDDQEIVLDFFAGSGTTAQAVLEENIEDGCNRRFILVQLPEPTDSDRYLSIMDIAKTRVRSIIDANASETEVDLGFRFFKLSSSNFKIWDANAEPGNSNKLAYQLKLFADNIQTGRSEQDLLYEILLKSGFPLTVGIKKFHIGSQFVFSILEGALLICLDDNLLGVCPTEANL